MPIQNKKKQPKRRDIHRKILERARVSPDCIDVATSKASAEANPVGRATTRLLESIINRRPFDAYCHPVLGNDNKDEANDSRGVFQQVNDIRPAHRPLHEIRAEAEAKVGAIRRKGENPELLDQLSNVEYEPIANGPPGLRPPIKGILKSRGNERFFQDYDGEWERSLPEGSGHYAMSNGSIFCGQFRQGQPHGHGQFTTPALSPTKDVISYEGEYQAGLPHGRGICQYRGGIAYDGDWKFGRRDGQGKITYPNKSQYIGGFRRGQMHGHGTFTSPTSGITYSGTFRNGFVSGEGCLTIASGATIIKNWQTKDYPKTGRGDRKNGKTVMEAIEHMMTHEDSGQDVLGVDPTPARDSDEIPCREV